MLHIALKCSINAQRREQRAMKWEGLTDTGVDLEHLYYTFHLYPLMSQQPDKHSLSSLPAQRNHQLNLKILTQVKRRQKNENLDLATMLNHLLPPTLVWPRQGKSWKGKLKSVITADKM